jgi:hypothetical protein
MAIPPHIHTAGKTRTTTRHVYIGISISMVESAGKVPSWKRYITLA